MILSTNQRLGEWDAIRQPGHVAQVWASIEAALPDYWDAFVAASRLPNRPVPESPSQALARVFDKALGAYDKESATYRRFFQEAAFDEYRDDPGSFKQALARDVPVIAGPLRDRRPELKDWQIAFHACRSKDLLQVFSNVLDFTLEWLERHPSAAYSTYDRPEEFELDALDNDPTMVQEGVIGMGIKSIVLYHLEPARLPARGRYGLYGLYFLAGKQTFGLASGSSEFLMINDRNLVSNGSMVMDQNYWYPYGLYSTYTLRIYRWIAGQAAELGLRLDDARRYIYVERFFQSVHDRHAADLSTMRVHDRFAVPG